MLMAEQWPQKQLDNSTSGAGTFAAVRGCLRDSHPKIDPSSLPPSPPSPPTRHPSKFIRTAARGRRRRSAARARRPRHRRHLVFSPLFPSPSPLITPRTPMVPRHTSSFYFLPSSFRISRLSRVAGSVSVSLRLIHVNLRFRTRERSFVELTLTLNETNTLWLEGKKCYEGRIGFIRGPGVRSFVTETRLFRSSSG